MGIEVSGYGYRTMPEPFRGNFKVHSLAQHQGSMDVAQVVQPQVPEAQGCGHLFELLGDLVWGQGTSIGMAKY
jgi:hypothetical protein